MIDFYINSIFTSIQGEGYFTGTLAHFIRFQGCPLHCWFCDTKHAAVRREHHLRHATELFPQIRMLVMDNPSVSHAVLTGGEPFYENDGISYLISLLWELGLMVHIETSGAFHLCPLPDLKERSDRLWITVSPKMREKGDLTYLQMDRDVLNAASEIKFVISDELDLSDRIPHFFGTYGAPDPKKVHLCFQPMVYDGEHSADLISMCIEAVRKYGGRLSIQTHKFLGLE